VNQSTVQLAHSAAQLTVSQL